MSGNAMKMAPRFAGFDPRQEVARVHRGHEGALVCAVAVIALAVSSVWLPGFSWASSPTSVHPAENAGAASAQHQGTSAVSLACAGQNWGAESPSCVAAIALASGRARTTQPRYVQAVVESR